MEAKSVKEVEDKLRELLHPDEHKYQNGAVYFYKNKMVNGTFHLSEIRILYVKADQKLCLNNLNNEKREAILMGFLPFENGYGKNWTHWNTHPTILEQLKNQTGSVGKKFRYLAKDMVEFLNLYEVDAQGMCKLKTKGE